MDSLPHRRKALTQHAASDASGTVSDFANISSGGVTAKPSGGTMSPTPGLPITIHVTTPTASVQQPADIDPGLNMKPAERKYIPDGLPKEQHLTMHDAAPLGQAAFYEWEKNMRRLFRVHGVLHIMRDACGFLMSHVGPYKDYGIDDERWEEERDVVLYGAKKNKTSELCEWDASDDMTLLLRADALIDASIDKSVAVWVAGVEDPHRKWWTLKKLLGDENDDDSTDRLLKLFGAAEDFNYIRAPGGIQGHIQRFMEIRADVVAIYGPRCWQPKQFAECLVTCLRGDCEAFDFLGDIEYSASTGLYGFTQEVIKKVEAFYDEMYEGQGRKQAKKSTE